MKKIMLLVVIAVILTSTIQAQDSTLFNSTFNHLALSVKDVNRSVEFYKKVLKLHEITNRTQKEGIRWLSLGEDKELHLISLLKEPFSINKAIHLAMTIPNFDAFTRHLDVLNITFSDWAGTPHTISTRADGIKQLYFQDPDGYWIEVNNIGQH